MWESTLTQWRAVDELKSQELSVAADMGSIHLLNVSVGLRWYEFCFEGIPQWILGRHNCHMCDRPYSNLNCKTGRSPLFCMQDSCPTRDYSSHYARSVCVSCADKGLHRRGNTDIDGSSYESGCCDLCSFNFAQQECMEQQKGLNNDQKNLISVLKVEVEKARKTSLTKTLSTKAEICHIVIDESVVNIGLQLEDILIGRKDYVPHDIDFINIDIHENEINGKNCTNINMCTSCNDDKDDELLCMWSTHSSHPNSHDDLKMLIMGRAKIANNIIKKHNIKTQSSCGG